MPAVLRPALCCVTRLTLTSVFDRLRNINFCRLRTRLRSPSCDALKILCRRRPTLSSTGRQYSPSQSSPSPWGPFTSTVSNLSASAGITIIVSSKTHLTHDSFSRQGARASHGIRPVIRTRRLEDSGTAGIGFLLPFGHRRWLLGSSCSRPTVQPSSRSAHQKHSGSGRGYHVPHAQDPAGEGAASIPGWRCSRDRPNASGRRLPLHNG